LLSWRTPIETQSIHSETFVSPSRYLSIRIYMSFILLNFTHSITRIYCNTNVAQNTNTNKYLLLAMVSCNKAQLRFQKPLFTYSGWSKHELYIDTNRIISPINHNQFAHVHPICTVHKMNPRYLHIWN